MREEAVYGHRNLGQETEQGIDPVALFPLTPRSEIDGQGMKATPLQSTKSTSIRIVVLRIDAYDHLLYRGAVMEGLEKM